MGSIIFLGDLHGQLRAFQGGSHGVVQQRMITAHLSKEIRLITKTGYKLRVDCMYIRCPRAMVEWRLGGEGLNFNEARPLGG